MAAQLAATFGRVASAEDANLREVASTSSRLAIGELIKTTATTAAGETLDLGLLELSATVLQVKEKRRQTGANRQAARRAMVARQ